MYLFNTLTRQKEEFIPLKKGIVTFYHCGPTVYWTQHIGNLRGMTMGDLLRRSLEYFGYEVKHARNYTDVGHLTSDGDTGEDKMAKGAKREGLTATEIANKYIAIFEKDTAAMNILEPTFKPRATEFIVPMQHMVQVLLDKGYAYVANLAVYYDVSKFTNYNALSHQNLEAQAGGAGKGTVDDPQKRNAQDFALWFFKKGAHANALQTWDSPWGLGFPGWHLECSVMSSELLGKTIDIRWGGVEHIPVHHTNEIAQSEAVNGVKFVNYWLHNEHLLVNNRKMAKSEGTSYVLQDIIEHGFTPSALRYFFLQAHYRSSQNFTWEALSGAASALEKLRNRLAELQKVSVGAGDVLENYKEKFDRALADDLNLPQALSVVWELVRDEKNSPADVIATLLSFDKVLGLNLETAERKDIPPEIQALAQKRWELKKAGKYVEADKLRQELESKGYVVKDGKDDYLLKQV
jgi:cysteinyl-tRNA synthetase